MSYAPMPTATYAPAPAPSAPPAHGAPTGYQTGAPVAGYAPNYQTGAPIYTPPNDATFIAVGPGGAPAEDAGCAQAGCYFSWIPLVGFINYCSNKEAPEGAFVSAQRGLPGARAGSAPRR